MSRKRLVQAAAALLLAANLVVWGLWHHATRKARDHAATFVLIDPNAEALSTEMRPVRLGQLLTQDDAVFFIFSLSDCSSCLIEAAERLERAQTRGVPGFFLLAANSPDEAQALAVHYPDIDIYWIEPSLLAQSIVSKWLPVLVVRANSTNKELHFFPQE